MTIENVTCRPMNKQCGLRYYQEMHYDDITTWSSLSPSTNMWMKYSMYKDWEVYNFERKYFQIEKWLKTGWVAINKFSLNIMSQKIITSYFKMLSLVPIASNSKPRPTLMVFEWIVMVVWEGFCWLHLVAGVPSYTWNIVGCHACIIWLLVWWPCISYKYDCCCWLSLSNLSYWLC